MEYNYNSLTGAALLRADSNSQKIEIEIGNTTKSLISEDDFWGKSLNDGLYFDYKSSENKGGYTVTSEGWNDYTERLTEKMSIEKTSEWIDKNVLYNGSKNLCVIQGYAGCGKTTFVRSILRKEEMNNPYFKYHDFYIGHVKNATEDTYISSSIRAEIINKITSFLQEDDGMIIYDNFVNLFKLDLSQLSNVLYTEFAPIFYSNTDASLYKCAKQIYDNRSKKDKKKYVQEFRVQFNNALSSKIGIVRYTNDDRISADDYINELLDVLLFIDFLWYSAVFLTRCSPSNFNQIIVYDNLDIIDNHYVIADFIDTLRSVLSNFNIFKKKNDYRLPTFKVLLTVRKITYAAISRFAEVGYNEMYQTPPDVNFLDISNLYISSSVLKHKANFLLNKIDTFVPPNAICRKSIESFLGEILNTSSEIFTDIKFSELLNHNLRACANMLEQIISCPSYKKYIDPAYKTHMTKKYKSAIWIHSMCSILRDNGVLNSLGYNLSSTDDINYPTTLSRMILTYLFNRRLGCMRGVDGFTSSDISFKDIIETFEKIPFDSFKSQVSWESVIIPELEKNYNKQKSQEKVVQHISKMLQRNNSFEESELWRRPIYYTHNAFPIKTINQIEQTLLEQIRSFSSSEPRITSFCITDEGYTFIEKVATHFEFYSVRFNNRLTEPIYCITDDSVLDQIILRVYNQVEYCVKKQLWLMKFYIKKHNISKNKYLNELFHPRTDDFSPQLHIVRTIYHHIAYLNEYRDYLHKHIQGENSIKLNICIVKWIGRYLALYRKYLYNELKDTDGAYNNDIWLDLKYLYWLVDKDVNKNGFIVIQNQKISFITISRSSNVSREKQKEDNYNLEYRASDEELLNTTS